MAQVRSQVGNETFLLDIIGQCLVNAEFLNWWQIGRQFRVITAFDELSSTYQALCVTNHPDDFGQLHYYVLQASAAKPDRVQALLSLLHELEKRVHQQVGPIQIRIRAERQAAAEARANSGGPAQAPPQGQEMAGVSPQQHGAPVIILRRPARPEVPDTIHEVPEEETTD